MSEWADQVVHASSESRPIVHSCLEVWLSHQIAYAYSCLEVWAGGLIWKYTVTLRSENMPSKLFIVTLRSKGAVFTLRFEWAGGAWCPAQPAPPGSQPPSHTSPPSWWHKVRLKLVRNTNNNQPRGGIIEGEVNAESWKVETWRTKQTDSVFSILDAWHQIWTTYISWKLISFTRSQDAVVKIAKLHKIANVRNPKNIYNGRSTGKYVQWGNNMGAWINEWVTELVSEWVRENMPHRLH